MQGSVSDLEWGSEYIVSLKYRVREQVSRTSLSMTDAKLKFLQLIVLSK